MALPKAVGYMVVLLVIFYSLENQGNRESLNVFFEELMGVTHTHAREKRVASLNSSDYVVQAVISVSDLELLQTLLRELSFPFPINSTSEISSIDTTTVCSSNMTAYQCRCEENYAWSYNNCINHEACDAIIGDTCGCINALPTDGHYCRLNTSQTDPVDIEIVLDLRIPVSSVPSNFINLFRDNLANLQLPHSITRSLNVTNLDFTTWCFPNSTGGPQCECEAQFAWSCNKCDIYGACSNATSQTCSCINGLPSDGEFCEPITNVSQCLTPTSGLTTTTPLITTTLMTTLTTPVTTTTTPLTTTTTQMSTTSTPMTTTTPLTTTTTTQMSTTSTPMTTTTTTTTTTMAMTTAPMTKATTPVMITIMPITTTTTTTTTEEMNLTFTLDMAFNSSYNDPTHRLYQDSFNSIKKQSEKYISTLKAVKIIEFRSGSTICNYAVTAASFQESEINAVKVGIFIELADKYPMLYDSQKHLKFDPDPGLFGERVTVTCGPPENLNFGTDWEADWRRNNIEISQDSQHKISNQNGVSTLTVSNFFRTDVGLYECMLRRKNRSAFRQRSNGQFNTLLIQVRPARKRIQCVPGKEELLKCSVNSPYEVEFINTSTTDAGDMIDHIFEMTDSDCESAEKLFTCQVKNYTNFNKTIQLLLSKNNSFDCEDDGVFGVGNKGEEAVALCEENSVGQRKAVCNCGSSKNCQWEKKTDTCTLQQIQELLQQSEFLTKNSLPEFLDELSSVTVNFTEEVVESPANINAIVEILNNIAKVSADIPINKTLMEDILLTAGVLTTNETKKSWDILNTNDTRNTSLTRSNSSTAKSVSSTLLESLENITKALTSDSFDIDTPNILLNKTTFTDTFNADFEILDSSVETDIPESDGVNKSITVITFASMENVLPARDENNSDFKFINGRVVLVYSNRTINNVSFTFDILNDTLRNPQCVFWNFSLFNGLGGWDDEGCDLVRNNKTVTCNCNHLTSFSILMSPYSPNNRVLSFITYIGVGISMASLVICLIIEAVIWRKIRKNNTSYLRHVSIVNIAVSLLIANIWFMIGAAISEKTDTKACTAATFFIHFFYLALFFWMLASGLLLLYRTVSVFEGLSKKSMLAIGFILGYGAPLIIVIITIAVTAPNKEYIRKTGCWLNWDESKALLAFVIPALLIVVINLIILCVVIYKMLRRRAIGNAAQAAERNALVVIARSLAVLTPFFGLTWGLGVGTMVEPRSNEIHGSFAFFNSLQGFFILVFGTLLDKKVRSEIATMSQSSRTGTRSTSAGTSSSSGLGFLWNWRRGRDGYNVSSSASGVSHSFTST